MTTMDMPDKIAVLTAKLTMAEDENKQLRAFVSSIAFWADMNTDHRDLQDAGKHAAALLASLDVPHTTAREEAVAKLMASGISIAEIHVPADAIELDEETRDRLGTIPEGTPTTTEIINSDREE